MNTFSRLTTGISAGFVGIVAAGILSAGAAAAHPQPLAPNGAPIPVASAVAPAQAHAGATSRAQVLLQQKAHAEHIQRLLVAREAAAVDARRQAAVGQGSSSQAATDSQAGSGAQVQANSGTASRNAGSGTDVAVLAVTALAGLALGAAGSTAAHRLRQRGLTA